MQAKWQKAGIEALICAPYVSCAFKAKNAGDMGGFFDYSIIWNILHYPAGVVPVSEVHENE